MYVDSCTVTVSGKQYTRHLLRESFRKNGKVAHNTLANLSHCSEAEIQAIKLALKHKHNLQQLGNINEDISVQQGVSCGAVGTLWQVAQRIGLVEALGSTQDGKRALWQVFARVLEQGSRLSAVRLANAHAACDILELEDFDEDDLYDNLDWLAEHQQEIEDRLFRLRYGTQKPDLYLYDVTSSYLEGTCNALGAFGYCRDGKTGKMQVVYGLLCDFQGIPVSIEAFAGNTIDTKTFGAQVHKVTQRFGGGAVTFVGDRGMIKGPQIRQLQAEKDHQFHYITAITKPQVEALLKRGVIQMSLFDETLAEVLEESVRYVLRRNPERAEEIATGRKSKLASLQKLVDAKNAYLASHPRATVAAAQREIEAKQKKLRLPDVNLAVVERTFSVAPQADAWAEAAKLDGCYCLKTDVLPGQATKETIHDRYKDLRARGMGLPYQQDRSAGSATILRSSGDAYPGPSVGGDAGLLARPRTGEVLARPGTDCGRGTGRTEVSVHDARHGERTSRPAQCSRAARERSASTGRGPRHPAEDDRRSRRTRVH